MVSFCNNLCRLYIIQSDKNIKPFLRSHNRNIEHDNTIIFSLDMHHTINIVVDMNISFFTYKNR
jgi:hypothetical protein